MSNRRPTIKDVADSAGVSIATVSRVLNGHQAEKTEKAVAVRQAAEELSYQPSPSARHLRTRRAAMVAIVVADIRNVFFADIVRGAEEPLAARGYPVVLFNSDEDRWKEQAHLELALREQMAGVIVCPASSGTTDVSALVSGGIPVVSVDRALNADVDTVLSDNQHGGFLATSHLMDEGYKRVACITGPPDTTSGNDRLTGWRAAHELRGLAVEPTLADDGNFREGPARRAATRMLTSASRPDAFFAANNPMAVGVMAAILEAGLSIPDEVGLVGYDEVPWAKILRPTLTTIRQSGDDMGRIAANLLLTRIGGNQLASHIEMLPTSLERGQSSIRHSARALVK